MRYEALSALHGLAKNYTAALALHWDVISHAVELNVKAQRSSGSGSAPASPSTAPALPFFSHHHVGRILHMVLATAISVWIGPEVLGTANDKPL